MLVHTDILKQKPHEALDSKLAQDVRRKIEYIPDDLVSNFVRPNEGRILWEAWEG